MIGKVIALTAICLLVAGACYQYASTKIDDYRYPCPGTMIDMGGYKLHIIDTGSGGPTVVLDSGMGSPAIFWELAQLGISKFTRCVSYDRGGYGWSDTSPKSRDSETVTEELYTLLKKANIPGPYILVGASLGGYNVRLFASKYPNEVIGVVLVDACHEDQGKLMPRFKLIGTWAKFIHFAQQKLDVIFLYTGISRIRMHRLFARD